MNQEFVLGGVEGCHFLSLKDGKAKLSRVDKKKSKIVAFLNFLLIFE